MAPVSQHYICWSLPHLPDFFPDRLPTFFLPQSSVTFKDLTITNCNAASAAADVGGGIFAQGSTVELDNVVVSNCKAVTSPSAAVLFAQHCAPLLLLFFFESITAPTVRT